MSDYYVRCLRCNGFFKVEAQSNPYCSDYCRKIAEANKPVRSPTKAERVKFEMESYRF